MRGNKKRSQAQPNRKRTWITSSTATFMSRSVKRQASLYGGTRIVSAHHRSGCCFLLSLCHVYLCIGSTIAERIRAPSLVSVEPSQGGSNPQCRHVGKDSRSCIWSCFPIISLKVSNPLRQPGADKPKYKEVYVCELKFQCVGLR